MSADLVSVLRLHLATLHQGDLAFRLFARSGRAEEVFRRPQELLDAGIAGVTPRLVARLRAPGGARHAEEEIRRCEREGISILVRGTAGYPESIRNLDCMPLVLFCRGRLAAEDRRAAGIVGARHPSPYGLRQARRFAAGLAGGGAAVVSGLARGIDGAAQEAALEAGGRTLAVLGSGLGRIYPPEHRRLAEAIAASGRGALLSEFAFETPPRAFHFPQRNRLLSGLSALVLVVEAGVRSGSLITVEWALQQGKSVYAIPGRVDQPQALGGLKLLQDGAIPALAPEDLFPELGIALPRASPAPAERRENARPLDGPLGERLERLFQEEDAWSADLLAERLRVPPGKLLPELARLELEGRLRRTAAGAYELA